MQMAFLKKIMHFSLFLCENVRNNIFKLTDDTKTGLSALYFNLKENNGCWLTLHYITFTLVFTKLRLVVYFISIY